MKKESFKQYFIQRDPSSKKTIAIFPGGFKPPTKGHFNALKELLDISDEGVVFIGKSERDGITQDMSYHIWSIYLTYLQKPVRIVKSPVTPVNSTYKFADDNPQNNIIVGAGDKDKDIERYNYFIKNSEKYPNVIIHKISSKSQGISGSKVRELISYKDPSVIDFFVPEVVSDRDRQRIKSILHIA